eukprot:865491-Pyramimonas_sp.AAC.1
MQGDPVYTGIQHLIDRRKTIPLGVHGDKAATTKTQSLLTISWTSLLGQGSTKETHQVFTTIKSSDITGRTQASLWTRFAWSMNALCDGRIPNLDWKGRPHPEAGRPIIGGYKAALIHLRGDWEFLADAET